MRAGVNGIEMNFEVSGRAAAPAVVLHHPLATTLRTWDGLTAVLERDYRVVRFDARGHGASEAPEGPYDFETLTGDVVGLMDLLGIGTARYLGLSMGGMIGQYLGLVHPRRFHSLTLVSTSSRVPAEAIPLWEGRIRDAATLGMASLVEGSMARWLAPATIAAQPALALGLREMFLATPAAGYIGWCHAIRGLDVSARLPAIGLPTLVVAGALDPAAPPAAAEVIHRAIGGSQLAVLAGVSHMLHVEDPAAFHAAVVPFLDAHGPRA